MAKGRVLIGPPSDSPSPSPATAEAAAFGYFHDRAFAGDFAPRPPIERWSEDQRRRFLAELRRLEDERANQGALAVRQVSERT